MGKTWKHHPHRPKKARKAARRKKIPGLATDRNPAKLARSLVRERELVEEYVRSKTNIPTGRKRK